MKALVWIIGIVVLLVAGVGVYVVLNSGNLIKTAVERIGPQVLGAPVSLGAAEISLTEGSGELRNLKIGNPSGFSGPDLMKIGRIALTIDPSQVSGDLVVIKSLVIDAAEVGLIAEGTKTNIQAIMDNLAGDDSGGDAAAEPAAGDTTKLIIDAFSFTNARTALVSDLIGEKSVSLPDIQLSGIGRESSGVTAREAAYQIFRPIAKASAEAVAREGLGVDDLKKSATEKINEAVGSGLDSLRERLEKP